MYSLNYKVTTSACDSEGRLKLYSALQMMPISLQFVLEEVLGQAKRPQVERKDSSPKYSLVGL